MLPTTFYGKGFAFMCSIGFQWRRGLWLGGFWKTTWVGSSQDGFVSGVDNNGSFLSPKDRVVEPLPNGLHPRNLR